VLKIFLLSVVLNAADLTYKELEKYYWDCDTAFMKGEMGGQDLNGCLAVTEEFQKHFETRDHFMIYWHEHRLQEWAERHFYPALDFI